VYKRKEKVGNNEFGSPRGHHSPKAMLSSAERGALTAGSLHCRVPTAKCTQPFT